MRARLSVANVGIDAGGSALAVVARLPPWPPTLMPTSSAMAAVRNTAVIIRLVIGSSAEIRAIDHSRSHLLTRWRVVRQIPGAERRAVGQHHAHDAADGSAVLDRLEHHGDLIADLERLPRPAALRHGRRVLRFERPVAHAARVVHRIDLEEAMRVGPDPLRDRPFHRDALRGVEARVAVMRAEWRRRQKHECRDSSNAGAVPRHRHPPFREVPAGGWKLCYGTGVSGA